MFQFKGIKFVKDSGKMTLLHSTIKNYDINANILQLNVAEFFLNQSVASVKFETTLLRLSVTNIFFFIFKALCSRDPKILTFYYYCSMIITIVSMTGCSSMLVVNSPY